ncbi:MAG: YHS domain-containing (seleno)protein [Planctomycetota bacterium]
MFNIVRTAALALTLTALAPVLTAPAAAQTSAAAPTALVQDAGDAKRAATPRPALKEYDLGKKSLALGGYDPVAYFPEGGSKATKGSKKITAKHRGVLYRFASEKNKKAFVANPDRFEPAYGGWCAWAMADGKGSKTEANPKSFTVEDGRLYVFYDGFWGDTRKQWKKNGSAPKLKSKSDTNWKRFSGEAPKLTDTERKKKEADEAAKKAKEEAQKKADEKTDGGK